MTTASGDEISLKRVVFEGSSEDWDDVGSRFSDFTINQSYAWGAGRRADGWTVSRDLWIDGDGGVVAMVSALRKRIRGVRLVYISRGPVVLKDGLTTAEVERNLKATISGYRRSLGWGEALVCILNQNPAQISPVAIRDAGLLPLFPPWGEYNFSAIVHLEEQDSLVKGASADWRKLFRRSQDLLDRVESTDDVELFLSARDLVARLEAEKGFTTTLTPQLIREIARTRARLFYINSENGEMMAALLVALCTRRASRFLAGVASDEARAHPGIGRVLEVAASRWAFDSGVHEYDVEGITPRNPGVTAFKKGMRGKNFAFSGRHVLSRPAFLAPLFAAARQRPWSQAIAIWRISKRYFSELYLRRLSGRRLAWERLRFYRRELPEKIPLEDRPGYGVEIIDRFDRAAFAYTFSTVRPLWERLERLQPGVEEICVIIDKHRLVAGYGFLVWKRAPVPEIESELEMEDGEVYCMGFFVLPEHRGRGLFTHLLNQAVARMQRRGCTAALAAANPANLPSARGIERCGFVPDRDVLFRKIAGWRSRRWVPPKRST